MFGILAGQCGSVAKEEREGYQRSGFRGLGLTIGCDIHSF